MSKQLANMIPLAVTRLGEAVNARESWAIRFLLEAAGFEHIAGKVLEEDNEGDSTIVSTAFEREMIENMLRALRNPTAVRPAGEGDRIESE